MAGFENSNFKTGIIHDKPVEILQSEDESISEKSAAFTKIMESCYDDLVGYISSIVGCRDLAEDIAQDTLLVAWERPERFEQRDVDIMAWLIRIARNKSIDLLRRQKTSMKHINTATYELVPQRANPFAELIAKETINTVQSLPNDRGTFLIQWAMGYNTEEIAAMHGASQESVSAKIYRARHSDVLSDYRAA